MTKKREIEIEIGPTGEIQVHVSGYKGPACMEILKLFEKELGEVLSRTLTPEYYETEIIEEDIRIEENQG